MNGVIRLLGVIGFFAAIGPLSGYLVRAIVRFGLLDMMPLKDAARSETLKIFHHPKPRKQPHIMFVPYFPVKDAFALRGHPKEAAFWRDVSNAIQDAAEKCELDDYLVVFNVGARQEVMQLHLHLGPADLPVYGVNTPRTRKRLRKRFYEVYKYEMREAGNYGTHIQALFDAKEKEFAQHRGLSVIYHPAIENRPAHFLVLTVN